MGRGHDPGGPAVHPAGVAHQVAHDPLGARGHGCIGAGGTGRPGHALALEPQHLDVL